ncbi:MAG: DUF916 domain-containing protein [Kineosporiaceae bacterium]|nr:DUF916 domain-containing protein [Aeromicrobium sp.]
MSKFTTPASFFIALALVVSPAASAAFGADQASVAVSPARVSVVAAAGDVSWSVGPVPNAQGARASFDYSVGPGTQILDSVRITNSGTTAAEFVVYATDAINEYSTGAFGLKTHAEKSTDAGSWITFDRQKITINPGMQTTVPFSLVIPSDATPGDHVAGVVASVLTTTEKNGSAVVVEQRVGARVYLTVSGATTGSVALAGLVSGFAPAVNPFAPGTLTVSYNLKNTGNVRLDVNQKLQITGPFGIALGEFTPKPLANFLPRQTVQVKADVPAIVALAFAWSTVTVAPGKVGNDGKVTPPGSLAPPPAAGGAASTAAVPAAVPTSVAASPASAPSAPAVAPAALDFQMLSSTVTALAISWTMLVLVALVLVAAYLIWRYVANTRERLYFAIEEATAAAREEALSVVSAATAVSK